MIDYIIVGSGIAGISFSEIALQNAKKIFVFDNNSQNSSRVAAGIYNPVILKRFSEVWNAKQQLEYLNIFYSQLESKLDINLDFKIPVLRKLFSVEEQNNWFVAADKLQLSPFLSHQIHHKKYKGISSNFGFGEVLHTGYIDTGLLLESYHNYLRKKELLSNDAFNHSKVKFHSNYISYDNIKAREIIFAEGFGLHANPFFNYLPLDGTKGELLVIKTPNLKLDCILNSSIYILPIKDGLYKVGATYNWIDKTNKTTQEGKEELLSKIRELIDCDFEIVDHLAGVRPTVKDRKPLVGTHPTHKNIHILNGLGTRGIMLGPSLAYDLYQHIENKIPLNPYIDIKRFS
jgi:glycine oxidase